MNSVLVSYAALLDTHCAVYTTSNAVSIMYGIMTLHIQKLSRMHGVIASLVHHNTTKLYALNPCNIMSLVLHVHSSVGCSQTTAANDQGKETAVISLLIPDSSQWLVPWIMQ